MPVETKTLHKRTDLEVFLFWSEAKPKRTGDFKAREKKNKKIYISAKPLHLRIS